MNVEEPRLSLCHVRTKNVDRSAPPTSDAEGVAPRIPVLMMDTDAEERHLVPAEASETYLMPQLTDNLQVEEDNHLEPNTLEIDELNGNEQSHVQASPGGVKSTDLILSNDEQREDGVALEKLKDDAEPAAEEGEDGADMDIGVDLSLDESGVLEAESANVAPEDRSPRETASRDAEASGRPPDATQTGGAEASAPDQAGLYPVVEESEDKHKPSGKRVTFPSDEEIVSGAVEPKDPWRHGNVCVCVLASR